MKVLAIGIALVVSWACRDQGVESGGSEEEEEVKVVQGQSDASPPVVTPLDGGAAGIATLAYAERREDLERLVTDLLKALDRADPEAFERLAHSLRLADPEAWFRQRFPDQVAEQLAREYAPIAAEIELVEKVLKPYVGADRRTIDVAKLERSDDERATGYQSQALKAMRKPSPLYSVRLQDKDSTFHLWSFAYDRGSFRFLGKMKRAAGSKPRKIDGHDLGDFRPADAQRIKLSQKNADDK